MVRRWSEPVYRSEPAFALIATILMLVMIMLLVVGMMQLGVIALRSNGRALAASTARANARMALMLAIGKLQKDTGPDTRVTARADILDSSYPPVLGAWKSWEGSDHDDQGRPISPGDYRTKKKERFLGWLVSGASGDEVPETLMTDESVTLVGPGAVGEDESRKGSQIHLKPVNINSAAGDGAYGWWVGGENEKARLPQPFSPENEDAAGWAVLSKSHAVANPAVFRMDKLLDDPAQAGKAPSLGQADLIAAPGDLPVSQEFFHDLSAVSVGLLTNTATGGWRKDLSLATENWSDLPTSKLPFFRRKPDEDLLFSKPTSTDATADKSMLYPWSSYRGGNDEIPIYKQGAIGSWENMKEWITCYKRVSSSSDGHSTIPYHTVSIDDAGNSFEYLHRLRIMPVVARIQWVLSHSGAPVALRPGYYEPRLLLTPVVTMWNPYSVQITAPEMVLNVLKPLPVALRYTVRSAQRATYSSLISGGSNNQPALSGANSLSYKMPAGLTLKPGESRIFSPAARNVLPATSQLVLQEGYRGTGGNYFTLPSDTGSGPMQSPDGALKALAKFDTSYTDINQGVGIYFDTMVNNQRHLAYRMIYPPTVANIIYPPITGLAETTLSAAASAPVPFLSTVFGTRLASSTYLASKGFVQSSPLVFYTAMGEKDIAERTIARHYGGTRHPVNSPFDYSFLKHAPGGDSYLPNASDTSGRGYIVTGFNKADGLSRCIVAEIPTRPVISLGELQGWDARFENPIPPYAYNLVGNSDATPLLPANAVVNSADASLAANLQHDDSYCLNHLLFDDWFFSSLTPDPAGFGSQGGRSLKDAYKDFVKGDHPLSNQTYRALPADTAAAWVSDDRIEQLYQDQVKGGESYRTIASRLEVDGMFNVNSTSVAAWRALLGHARNQKIPYFQESGDGWSAGLSGETDHAFSRFAIAGDVQAGKPGSSGDFPEASEFAGYRVLDDKLIDALAEEVVAQVRRRGPFLSLSEFINRQLSSGDLALAGTFQAALNKLSDAPATNPYAEIEATIQSGGRATSSPVLSTATEYKFAEAANGWSAFGLPGWTRQADILRPLAPVLSARDDTFTVRAYGDARDTEGRILCTAVCEAVVRRTADFVDPQDEAASPGPLKSEVNRTFGRRFTVVAFRWLNPSEI